MNRACYFKSLLTILFVAFFMFQCSKDTDEPVPDSKLEADGLYSLSTSGIGGGGTPSGIPGDSTAQPPVQSGQITAAEWNDLLSWDFWLGLGQNQEFNKAKENWNFNPSMRYSFFIKDIFSNPVADCEIALKNLQGDILWKTRTDNEGKAELWLNLVGGTETMPVAVVKYRSEEMNIVDPKPFENGINEVILSSAGVNLTKADILFVVDATGSMGDEITYLKSELLDVIERSENLNSAISLRIGSVFYRDEGDEYLTRVSPFTTNFSEALDFINDQEAAGGGDYEEAVHTALNTALTQLSWSTSARARLLFLLLDAPPHNTSGIVNDLNEIIVNAAAKGIKIIPISASGINKDTEFLFRFFAAATNGTYVFITNDSGIGGDHIEATVGDYEVELLNDLIVRLITKYTM